MIFTLISYTLLNELIYELNLIMNLKDAYASFVESWNMYKGVILELSKAYKFIPTHVQKALKDLVPGDSGECIFFGKIQRLAPCTCTVIAPTEIFGIHCQLHVSFFQHVT